MSDVIELKKKFNHRWKTDPLFIKGFDYDNPKYENVPDHMKWAIPVSEDSKHCQDQHAYLAAQVKQKIEKEKNRLSILKRV